MDNLLELLKYIDPAGCTYQEWVDVGMALKHEGHSCSEWDDWSRADSRYRVGECEKKWNTFHGSAQPVTGGTIVQMARDNGWVPPQYDGGSELGWDSYIGKREGVLYTDLGWVEGKELQEPKDWNPVQELTRYLETLFESTENVGYVTTSWERDGRQMPTKGNWDRTAGELIQALSKCGGDIGSVLGDYNPDVGAWIRFNPLDGKGIKNDNVTDFRYALVESDSMEIEKQHALLRELELPIACMVHSGKKSIHAIVRIDAATYEEYRKRVDYLYNVLRKNGLDVDTQNKNPSRLSRMPGVMRNGNKQWLIDTNIGKANFEVWKEWIESINDDLPDPDSLADAWNDMPDLAPALIDGVLRQGHKMLIAGPSKAGKSYALIELCIAVAEGKPWLGWRCAQGKILYVNLELDRASCLHRFRDIYNAMGYRPEHIQNIDIWNLRGHSVPMDKLAPKLIRRAAKKNYIAIVIDPIYKVITGDENSADQMAAFCNQFDKVCTELGAAVIYCHHHSKGAQGGKKSVDRSSGSGVFARDPDAILDMIELELTEDIVEQAENAAVCKACVDALHRNCINAQDLYSQDDACTSGTMLQICQQHIVGAAYIDLMFAVQAAKKQARSRRAWRIEGTLREFPSFPPVNIWFEYPVHRVDTSRVLHDLQSEVNSRQSPYKQNFKKKRSKEQAAQDKKAEIEAAYNACAFNGGEVSVQDIADYLGKTEKTARARIREHGGFWVDDGKIGLKNGGRR